VKRVLYIAVKEIVTIYRDKLSMLILVILPVILVTILGHALRFELIELPFGVIDMNNTPLSRNIIATLDESSHFSHRANIASLQEIDKLFIEKGVKFVIYIPEAIERGEKVELFIDGSDLFLGEAITQNIELLLTPKEEANISFRYNPQRKGEWITLPGLVMVSLIIVSTIMLGLSLNRERERGSARLLLITPASMSQVIIGKALPYIAISLLHAISVFFILQQLFGVGMKETLFPSLLLTLIFSINSMAYGLLIAALVKDELQLLIGCWLFLFIPNVFFSGFVYPIESMHSFILKIVNFIPGSLFINSYKVLIFKGVKLSGALYPLLNLLLQSLLLITLSISILKQNFFKK